MLQVAHQGIGIESLGARF